MELPARWHLNTVWESVCGHFFYETNPSKRFHIMYYVEYLEKIWTYHFSILMFDLYNTRKQLRFLLSSHLSLSLSLSPSFYPGPVKRECVWMGLCVHVWLYVIYDGINC